jgi:hypothetical protein
MERLFLVVGRVAAMLGCLASVVHGVSSVVALFDRSTAVTDAMVMRPFCSIYGFIINGALFVVCGRVMELASKPAAPIDVVGR